MAGKHDITLTVNGVEYQRSVEPRRRLGDFLREDLGLTGTHLSCEHGVCGVCTVIMDGKPALSCLTFAVQADGAHVSTVESLAQGDTLSTLQQKFWEKHALQCGFCTPGFLMALTHLFTREPSASDNAIAETIDGVLCRCTGYQNIFEAAVAARDALVQTKS